MTLVYFQVIGLTIDFIGAITIALSEILTRSEIKKMSGTYVGSNPHLEKYLKERNLSVISGATLLIIGFLLQILGFIL